MIDSILNKWDFNGNTYSHHLYTYSEALELSKTLINCKKCHNCSHCTDCIQCINCTDCVGGYKLYFCDNWCNNGGLLSKSNHITAALARSACATKVKTAYAVNSNGVYIPTTPKITKQLKKLKL